MQLNGVGLFIPDELASFVDRRSRGQEAGSRPMLPGYCCVALVGQSSQTHCSFVVYEMTVGPATPALQGDRGAQMGCGCETPNSCDTR